MFCRNCGAELPDDSRFCTSCGCDLAAAGGQMPHYHNTRTSGRTRPASYLVLSILVLIFCCVPFGIVGIVYASKVDSCWNAGKEEDAIMFSRKARNWCLWGIFLTAGLWIAYIILLALGISWAAWWDGYDTYLTWLP